MNEWNKLTAAVVAQDDIQAQAAIAGLGQAEVQCRTVESFITGELALNGAPFDLLVVQASGVDADTLGDFLVQLRHHAETQPMRVVVTTTLDEVDIVVGGLFDIRAEILCDAKEEELVEAILRMAEAPARTLHDSGNARAARLLQVQGEVDRLAAVLREFTAGHHAAPAPAEIAISVVKRMIWERRERDRYFDPGLFADPAWDMLLDLFVSDLEHRHTCVSSLCIAAATPPTTALRWIGTMTDAGLFERYPDMADKRRQFLKLGQDARRAMIRYFTALEEKPRA